MSWADNLYKDFIHYPAHARVNAITALEDEIRIKTDLLKRYKDFQSEEDPERARIRSLTRELKEIPVNTPEFKKKAEELNKYVKEAKDDDEEEELRAAANQISEDLGRKKKEAVK